MRESSHGETASVQWIVGEYSHGETVSVQWRVRESLHGEIVSVQRIARDSTAHKLDSVWRSGVQMITAEQRWIASVHWDGIVWCE